jgi:hypothetical protein
MVLKGHFLWGLFRSNYLDKTHGRLGWKERPFTRADLVSNLVSILTEAPESRQKS